MTLTYEIQSEIHVCVFTLGDYKTIYSYARSSLIRSNKGKISACSYLWLRTHYSTTKS